MASSSSSANWFIGFTVIITLIIFVLIVVYAIPIDLPKKQIVAPPAIVTTHPPSTAPPQNRILHQGDRPIPHTELRTVSNTILRDYIHALPETIQTANDLVLGGHPVQSVAIEKPVFFVYDAAAVYDPVKHSFRVTIVVELPPIKIVISPTYSRYYPLLNPYIHVAQFTYRWDVRADDTLDTMMRLETVELFLVDWDRNRYWNTYMHTVNSPMKIPDMPPPLQFTKEELEAFFLRSQLFTNLPVISENGFHAKALSSSTPIHIKQD